MALKGKVLTVLGPVEPSELGTVLPHEQPLMDLRGLWTNPRPGFGGEGDLSLLDFQLKNLGKIRQYPYSVRDNLIVDSEEEVATELQLFKSAGGGALCDVSPFGVRLKRDRLPWLSEQTGLHLIAGTSFYVDRLMPQAVKNMSLEEMRDFMVREVMSGVGGGVRCGVIGEVGCSHPLTNHERRSLQAAAAAQQITGAPLMIHCLLSEESPFHVLDLLESWGADLSHTVIAHLDFIPFQNEDLLRLGRRGCWLEFDQFGSECSHYQGSKNLDFLSDAQRIDKIKLLIDNEFSGRVLLSHDIHTKHRMACYGGHGYAHLLENVLPRFLEKGVDQSILTQITTDNPQRWLTFS